MGGFWPNAGTALVNAVTKVCGVAWRGGCALAMRTGVTNATVKQAWHDAHWAQ
jgi:hypothetical protein